MCFVYPEALSPSVIPKNKLECSSFQERCPWWDKASWLKCWALLFIVFIFIVCMLSFSPLISSLYWFLIYIKVFTSKWLHPFLSKIFLSSTQALQIAVTWVILQESLYFFPCFGMQTLFLNSLNLIPSIIYLGGKCVYVYLHIEQE